MTSTPMPSAVGHGHSPRGKSLADVEKLLNESQMALREMQTEYNTYRKEKMENEKWVQFSFEWLEVTGHEGETASLHEDKVRSSVN